MTVIKSNVKPNYEVMQPILSDKGFLPRRPEGPRVLQNLVAVRSGLYLVKKQKRKVRKKRKRGQQMAAARPQQIDQGCSIDRANFHVSTMNDALPQLAAAIKEDG